jgi:hypothetical protein
MGKLLMDRTTLLRAIGPGPHDLYNNILYEMCRDYPNHTDPSEIFAKLLMIGRVYAASLERRKGKQSQYRGDEFFLKCAVPTLSRSAIDSWFAELRIAATDVRYRERQNIRLTLAIHFKLLTKLKTISGMNNRSLTSKYLHFHFPNAFYIYDSRAVASLRRLEDRGARFVSNRGVDQEYENFAQRCDGFNSRIESVIGRRVSPRELDKILLNL